MAYKTEKAPLTVADRFEIFEQLNRHQLDNDPSLESAQKYVSLYWPEAKMTVNDLRHVTFEGPAGMKQMYDYAHSVFPLEKWSHSMGPFAIEGTGNEATVAWRWKVSWKADKEGVASTRTYADKFEKRNGEWRCLERVSDIDPNWPAELFQPFVDQEKIRFKSS